MITVNAHWLGRARAPKQNVVDYLLPLDTGEYNDADVRYITDHYWETGRVSGIDPLLACAQMIVETGHLTSHWSQRPRRNPAGIGVTGEPNTGVSFPSWALAIRAHVGRLLAYSLPYGAGTDGQHNLVEEALSWRPLAPINWGQGADVESLARYWAADPDYADKLVAMANRLIGG
jgi:Mannosyl-glycoprotein endo-beta-N-acetylglucosaminidase